MRGTGWRTARSHRRSIQYRSRLPQSAEAKTQQRRIVSPEDSTMLEIATRASSDLQWGLLTSLYVGLDEPHVAQLEYATKCRVFGRYKEAESQLLDCLEKKWSSAAVMELVTMYDRMGLEHKRALWAREILDTAATDSQLIPESLQHLCKLHLAESEVMIQGRLRAALREARHFRDWQIQFAVSQYTDIMVGKSLKELQSAAYISVDRWRMLVSRCHQVMQKLFKLARAQD